MAKAPDAGSCRVGGCCRECTGYSTDVFAGGYGLWPREVTAAAPTAASL